MVTGGMAIVIDHIEYITLHSICWEWNLVMGAVNIQVVIDTHIHRVVTMMEPIGNNSNVRYVIISSKEFQKKLNKAELKINPQITRLSY